MPRIVARLAAGDDYVVPSRGRCLRPCLGGTVAVDDHLHLLPLPVADLLMSQYRWSMLAPSMLPAARIHADRSLDLADRLDAFEHMTVSDAALFAIALCAEADGAEEISMVLEEVCTAFDEELAAFTEAVGVGRLISWCSDPDVTIPYRLFADAVPADVSEALEVLSLGLSHLAAAEVAWTTAGMLSECDIAAWREAAAREIPSRVPRWSSDIFACRAGDMLSGALAWDNWQASLLIAWGASGRHEHWSVLSRLARRLSKEEVLEPELASLFASQETLAGSDGGIWLAARFENLGTSPSVTFSPDWRMLVKAAGSAKHASERLGRAVPELIEAGAFEHAWALVSKAATEAEAVAQNIGLRYAGFARRACSEVVLAMCSDPAVPEDIRLGWLSEAVTASLLTTWDAEALVATFPEAADLVTADLDLFTDMAPSGPHVDPIFVAVSEARHPAGVELLSWDCSDAVLGRLRTEWLRTVLTEDSVPEKLVSRLDAIFGRWCSTDPVVWSQLFSLLDTSHGTLDDVATALTRLTGSEPLSF